MRNNNIYKPLTQEEIKNTTGGEGKPVKTLSDIFEILSK
jgi:hypothetical protein